MFHLRVTHPLLEGNDLFVRHGISLRNDRDKVNLSVKASHEFDVDRLQPRSRRENRQIRDLNGITYE